MNPQGDRLAVCAGGLRVSDLRALRVREYAVKADRLSWAPDGRRLSGFDRYGGSFSGLGNIWAIKEETTAPHPLAQNALWCGWSADGRFFAGGTTFGKEWLRDEKLALLPAPIDGVMSGTWSPTHSTLALSRYDDGTTQLFTPGEPPRVLPGPSNVQTHTWSPDGKRVSGITASGHLVVWEVEERRLRFVKKVGSNWPTLQRWSTDSKTLCVAASATLEHRQQDPLCRSLVLALSGATESGAVD
jgi:WD40 repeat protein